MRKNDINQGLYSVLEAGMSIGGAFPGVGDTPERPFNPPYFEVGFVGVQRDENLKGTLRSETGTLTVTIATEPGDGEVQANDLADQVAGLFPGALRLPITDGLITIIGTPNIRSGYVADSEFRVPVLIQYMATRA